MTFSVAACRPAFMAARRLASMSTTSIVAPLSTVANQQVLQLENMLASMHWVHLKDNVKEVRQLLNEPKTNRSLRAASSLEDEVACELRSIEAMMMKSSSPDLDAIESRVYGLKNHVRSQLYNLG
jgi:hypothetical protein